MHSPAARSLRSPELDDARRAFIRPTPLASTSRSSRSKIALVLGLATATCMHVACASDRSESPAPTSATQQHHDGHADPALHRAGPAELPWSMTLSATGDRTLTELTATITIATELSTPLTVALTEPSPGALLSGRQSRTLAPGASGVQRLVWQVKPLAGQYRVVANQSSSAAGFRAQRDWPPGPAAQAARPSETIQPTTAGGLTVHKAVRVD